MRPYELLARFKSDGTVGGIHVRYVETVGGRDYELDPIPLADVNDPAFSDFTTAINASLLAERDQLAIDAASVPSLEARIAELEAELDALKNPPGPDTSTIEGAKQWLAAERYKKETGGITVGGQLITTERDEIGHWFPRFFDALNWLQGDPTTRSLNPDGFYPYKPKRADSVVLTAAQVVRAYQCVAWYVNQCFAIEGSAEQALNAGSPIEATLNGIVWPQNAFEWSA